MIRRLDDRETCRLNGQAAVLGLITRSAEFENARNSLAHDRTAMVDGQLPTRNNNAFVEIVKFNAGGDLLVR